MQNAYDVIVIGAGQAGLALGYELKRAGLDFVILDASERIGASWRARWDSLTLFTPAEYSSLPGMRFPAPDGYAPTAREFADYLEAYAARFDLPVRLNERVVTLTPAWSFDGDERWTVRTETDEYDARTVVVATGAFQTPWKPAFADELGGGVRQIHSSEYRNPEQVGDGPVVVIGGGNSGVQIAAELAASGRETTLCIGSRVHTLPLRLLGRSVFDWLERIGYMDVRIDTRLGQRLSKRQIIIGESARAASKRTGMRLADRAMRATEGAIVTRAGAILPARTVIWATGFRPDFDWIDAPVFDERGAPVHRRGVTDAAGLHFLGLSWQHTRGSALIGWVGRDARYLARHIVREREGERRVLRERALQARMAVALDLVV